VPSVIAKATTWSIDHMGQIMLALSSTDGRLYSWSGDTSVRAQLVTAATGSVPTGAKAFLVTNQRIVMVLGADGDPTKVKWCDVEDYTDWAPVATNQAGSFPLQTNGDPKVAKHVRSKAILIWTTTDVHLAEYDGIPNIYTFNRVGTGCGIVSPQAAIVADDIAVWMSSKSFFIWDGNTKALPCEVADYVFEDMNASQTEKVFGIRVSKYGEMWWFYPSSGSVENNRYVVWNYRENHWNAGELSRLAGVDADVFPNSIWIDQFGYLHEHETGLQLAFGYGVGAYGAGPYSGSQVPYAESGPLELEDGTRVMHMSKLFPDEKVAGQVQVRFANKFYPNAEIEYDKGPYSLSSPTDLRFSARQIAIQIEGVGATDWRVGDFRLDAKARGKR
jgi:hypothetical protein